MSHLSQNCIRGSVNHARIPGVLFLWRICRKTAHAVETYTNKYTPCLVSLPGYYPHAILINGKSQLSNKPSSCKLLTRASLYSYADVLIRSTLINNVKNILHEFGHKDLYNPEEIDDIFHDGIQSASKIAQVLLDNYYKQATSKTTGKQARGGREEGRGCVC